MRVIATNDATNSNGSGISAGIEIKIILQRERHILGNNERDVSSSDWAILAHQPTMLFCGLIGQMADQKFAAAKST